MIHSFNIYLSRVSSMPDAVLSKHWKWLINQRISDEFSLLSMLLWCYLQLTLCFPAYKQECKCRDLVKHFAKIPIQHSGRLVFSFNHHMKLIGLDLLLLYTVLAPKDHGSLFWAFTTHLLPVNFVSIYVGPWEILLLRFTCLLVYEIQDVPPPLFSDPVKLWFL